MRQHASAIDIADHDDGQVRCARQAHIRQIGCAQIDLGGRPGALADHHVELGTQPGKFLGDHPGQMVAMGDVVGGTDISDRLAPHQQLGGAVTTGFEKHRVESDARRQTRGAGLHTLGPADLTATTFCIQGDHRVVTHILRLERGNPNPLARQQSAQTRNHHRLAGIGGGAGDQQCPAHHGRVRISAPSSVTTRVCSNCAVHLRSEVTTVHPSSQIS